MRGRAELVSGTKVIGGLRPARGRQVAGVGHEVSWVYATRRSGAIGHTALEVLQEAGVLRDDAVLVFVLPPSIAELEKRLKGRAQDSAEVVAKRMAKSRDEISHWAEYDYVLVNKDLPAAFEELKSIVVAERLRRDRQPDLSNFVRGLNAEFDKR